MFKKIYIRARHWFSHRTDDAIDYCQITAWGLRELVFTDA